MKRMSFFLRLVSSAARSPRFSMTGPLVVRMLTFISLAMTVASVVFPSPGGPYRQHVVERLLAPGGGLDADLDVFLDLVLADVLLQMLRPETQLEGFLLRAGDRAHQGVA